MTISDSGNILKTTLTSQSYANVYNLIKDNVSDPAGAVDRKWIHTREPSIKAGYDEDYPKIIIWPVTLSQDDQSLSATKRNFMWECEIEVRATDREEAGLGYMETINDALLNLFNGQTNKNTLRGYGMANVTLVLEDTDYVSFAQESVYISRFTLTFSKRMDTT